MTIEEATNVLGISPAYIRRAIESGELPARRRGESASISEQDLQDYAKAKGISWPGDEEAERLVDKHVRGALGFEKATWSTKLEEGLGARFSYLKDATLKWGMDGNTIGSAFIQADLDWKMEKSGGGHKWAVQVPKDIPAVLRILKKQPESYDKFVETFGAPPKEYIPRKRR